MFDDFYDNSSEYGYLIEMGEPTSPTYLSIGPLSYFYWSQNAYEAIRFCRPVDAENFLFVLSWFEVKWFDTRIVEHCFVVENTETEKL